MRYLAIEIDGGVHIMNDSDELGGLIDRDIEHQVLGEVCDDKEFGDRCTTDCQFFRSGTCSAENVRDVFGDLWKVRLYA